MLQYVAEEVYESALLRFPEIGPRTLYPKRNPVQGGFIVKATPTESWCFDNRTFTLCLSLSLYGFLYEENN